MKRFAISEEDQQELLELGSPECSVEPVQRLARVRQLYESAGVFETAFQLVDKHQDRAEQVADEIEPEALRRLFYFLVDTVLERPEMPSPAVVSLGITSRPATS